MSIREGYMMRRLIFAATAACGILAAATPASAGYWNYGCKGSLGGSAYVFDRSNFLIMPKALGEGDIAALVKGEIFSFDADDNNSGFRPVMKFARGAYPDHKIVLTQTSSKTISTQKGHVGTREKSTTTLRKAYHFVWTGWSDEPVEVDLVMDCIEYELTAP
jgi:hypothetical protein